MYISAVTGFGLDKLKDILWEELNSESNKLQSVSEGGSIVHRDREVNVLASDFADWQADFDTTGIEEEDDDVIDDDIYDIEDLED